MNFEDFPIRELTRQALSAMGFEEATPIQAATIPLALEGRDLIGQAQTGTGKTAAFGIPLIERVDPRERRIQAIVLAPTRELAMQVAEELNKIGGSQGIHVLPIYGGQDMMRQIRALRTGPQVVVGTPGRMLDHIRRGTIHLENVRFAVLDEADEMLNMGFIDDVRSIFSELTGDRQTLLFSATMPSAVRNLAETFLKNPEQISIQPKELTVPLIEQHYMEVHERQKFDVLCRLLDIEAPELAIVFGRTKRRVDELSDALIKRGYSADGLHGDLSQKQRDTVMAKFREGQIEVLVATDVAARGIDISGVTHVINFDVPQDAESYVHRIGRTGRAGREGKSLTFVTPREVEQMRVIERVAKHKIPKLPIPTMSEAFEGIQRAAVERLVTIINEQSYREFQGAAEQLLGEHDSAVLVAAALKSIARESKQAKIELTEEKPIRVKRSFNDRGRSYGDNNRYRGGGGYGRSGRNDSRSTSTGHGRWREGGEHRPAYREHERRTGDRPREWDRSREYDRRPRARSGEYRD